MLIETQMNNKLIAANIRISLTSQLPVLSVTDSIEDLLGFSAEDFLAGKPSLKSLIHPEDNDISDSLFSSAAGIESGTSGNVQMESGTARRWNKHLQIQ